MITADAVGTDVPWDAITASTAYHFWMPGVQAVGSGNVVDQSGSNDGVRGSNLSDANLWSNAGYFTTIANGTNDNTYMVVMTDAFSWNWTTHSLMFSFWLNAAAPLSNDDILGAGGDSTEAGFRILLETDGQMNPAINGGAQKAGGSTTGVIADSSDHHVTILVDGQTQLMYVYIDGALDASYSSGVDVSDAGAGSTASTVGMAFGGKNDAEGGDATLAAQFRDCHCLFFSGGLPDNIADLAKLVYSRPYYPLSVAEVGV